MPSLSRPEKTGGFYTLLSAAKVYDCVQELVGARQARTEIIQGYLQPKAGDRMLDIGCGTGEILPMLPKLAYDGFDMNPAYIEDARKRFGHLGSFWCQRVSEATLADAEPYDIVLAFGILHHLDDADVRHLFQIAVRALKPTGRLITVDPCFAVGQGWLARQMVKRDRGHCVRPVQEYQSLAESVFAQVKVDVRHDLTRIPYTHCILECRTG